MSTLEMGARVRRRALLGATLSVALLGGCASTGNVPGNGDTAATAAADASVVMPGGEALRVVEIYAAASGRTCRRLATADGTVLARVSCRQSNGEWTLGRALGGDVPNATVAPGGTSRSTGPAAPGATGTVVPALGGASRTPGERTVSEALRPDETLWAFAARVTGNPRNWTRIAEVNGIREVTSVQSGRALAVPASMLSPGR